MNGNEPIHGGAPEAWETAPHRKAVPYRLLVENLTEFAVSMLDPSGRVNSWNQGAEQITGFMPDDIVGRPVSATYPREDALAGTPERHLEIASREGRFIDQGWRIRKDGSRFWADVVITPLATPGKKPLGYTVVMRDITARRDAERQLHESEERFRLLVEGVKEYAIFMLDPTGHIVSWNAGAERIKGYTAEEVIGQHFSIFYPPEDVSNGKPERKLRLAVQNGSVEDEGWRVRKDGSCFFANVVITAIFDEDRTLLGFAKVTRDMTEKRAAEAERQGLMQARMRAEETNRAKDEFLMTLSHELRTPMTAILGWSRLLSTGALDENETRTAVQSIMQSAGIQARLIDDVLDLSRLISGKLQLRLQKVDPRSLAEQAVQTLRPAASGRHVEIVSQIDPDIGPVAADPDRLHQVIWNLLSNAIKFSRDHQQVTLRVQRADSDLEIIVEDQGEGIAPEFLPFVFEPFLQADSSATRPHGGLGLGLTIVRNLVELHDGRVEVFSEGRGHGATFKVTIPIVAIIEPGKRQSSLQRPMRNLERVRILYVDDHEPSRTLVSSILRHAGAVIDCAQSVEDAIQRLGKTPPDLLLTDIAMPDKDGFDLLRRVRKQDAATGRHTPVVALTALTRPAQLPDNANFDAWLTKPVEPEDLVAGVAEVLSRTE